MSFFLYGCASTLNDRIQQLQKKSTAECFSSFKDLLSSPSKDLILNQSIPGELSDQNCLVLASKNRLSYDVFEFVAQNSSHSIEILSVVYARGIGWGGDNIVVNPLMILTQNGVKIKTGILKQPPVWNNKFFDGPILQTVFHLNDLIPGKVYRIIVTTNKKFYGKELPGYYVPIVFGNIVFGPLGKIKLTLK